jgi:hypothetical protein
MKKVLLFAVVLGAVSLTSCKKDYTCSWTYAGTTTVTDSPGLSSSEADDAEAVCNNNSGTWETK